MRFLLCLLLVYVSVNGQESGRPEVDSRPVDAPTSRPRVTESLIEKANSANPYVSVRATENLSRCDGDVVGEILAFTKRRSIHALSPQVVTWLGTVEDPRARALLVTSLKDLDFPWRPFSVKALRRPRGHAELMVWLPWLDDGLSAVREAVILGLGEVVPSLEGPLRSALLDDLAKKVTDPSFEPRLAAAEVLVLANDSRGVGSLVSALSCTRRWFDVDYGELARRRAFAALGAFGTGTGFDPASPPGAMQSARDLIVARLKSHFTKGWAEGKSWGSEPTQILYGFEVRSCRRGDAFLRLTADGTLVMGNYDLESVKLEPGVFAELRKQLESLRSTPDSPFFGMGGCDFEKHYLPDEGGLRRFMVGVLGRPKGAWELVEVIATALEASRGDSEAQAFRDRVEPFGPDSDR